MRRPYLTDLSDAQWQAVAKQVFHGAPGAALREAVNAVRYRQRSELRWELLPHDLAATTETQQYESQWLEDGTWAAIEEMLRGPELVSTRRTGLDSIREYKRRCGNAVRRWAGGKFVLFPFRMSLHLLREVRELTRRSEAAPKLIDSLASEAERMMRSGQFARAIELHGRILELDPARHCSLINRAWAFRELEQYRESCEEAWHFLSLPPHHEFPRFHGYEALALGMRMLRDYKRAAGFKYYAKWARRRPDDIGQLLHRDRLDDDAAGIEVLMESHDELAEEAINYFTDFDTAMELFRENARMRNAYAARFPVLPGKTLYLSADWARNIGHMAYLDFIVKMGRLGWHPWSAYMLFAPKKATANCWYLNYLQKEIAVVDDPHLAQVMRHFVQTIGVNRVASLLELSDGTETYFCEGIGAIQEAWETQGNNPLLTLAEEDREFGRNQLEALGLPKEAWFACLHVRSPGFHRENDNLHQAHRNADITTYIPAVREVVRRGGWVVRIGDGTMPPMPKMPGLIDYALSKQKSERMDVILCASCRFFIGVASGISHIPMTFGVPCVSTNWTSNALPAYGRNDLFVPKLCWSSGRGRSLSFPEWMEPETRKLSYSGIALQRHGLRTIDNSEDELREVVVEMMDHLDGSAVYTPTDRLRQERFAGVARQNGLIGFPRVGRDFLRRHERLL